MKKLTVFILSFVVLFSNVFAYTPTAKDTAIVSSISIVFKEMAKNDASKANIFLQRLNLFKIQFATSNPRYSYIFGYLAVTISDEIENDNNDSDDENIVNTNIYLSALDGSDTANDLDTEKFGCDDKLFPAEYNRVMTPIEAIREMFDYEVSIMDSEEIYNILNIHL